MRRSFARGVTAVPISSTIESSSGVSFTTWLLIGIVVIVLVVSVCFSGPTTLERPESEKLPNKEALSSGVRNVNISTEKTDQLPLPPPPPPSAIVPPIPPQTHNDGDDRNNAAPQYLNKNEHVIPEPEYTEAVASIVDAMIVSKTESPDRAILQFETPVLNSPMNMSGQVINYLTNLSKPELRTLSLRMHSNDNTMFTSNGSAGPFFDLVGLRLEGWSDASLLDMSITNNEENWRTSTANSTTPLFVYDSRRFNGKSTLRPGAASQAEIQFESRVKNSIVVANVPSWFDYSILRDDLLGCAGSIMCPSIWLHLPTDKNVHPYDADKFVSNTPAKTGALACGGIKLRKPDCILSFVYIDNVPLNIREYDSIVLGSLTWLVRECEYAWHNLENLILCLNKMINNTPSGTRKTIVVDVTLHLIAFNEPSVNAKIKGYFELEKRYNESSQFKDCIKITHSDVFYDANNLTNVSHNDYESLSPVLERGHKMKTLRLRLVDARHNLGDRLISQSEEMWKTRIGEKLGHEFDGDIYTWASSTSIHKDQPNILPETNVVAEKTERVEHQKRKIEKQPSVESTDDDEDYDSRSLRNIMNRAGRSVKQDAISQHLDTGSSNEEEQEVEEQGSLVKRVAGLGSGIESIYTTEVESDDETNNDDSIAHLAGSIHKDELPGTV